MNGCMYGCTYQYLHFPGISKKRFPNKSNPFSHIIISMNDFSQGSLNKVSTYIPCHVGAPTGWTKNQIPVDMSSSGGSTVPSCQVRGFHDASQEADQRRWWESESGGSQKEQERGSSGVARGSARCFEIAPHEHLRHLVVPLMSLVG